MGTSGHERLGSMYTDDLKMRIGDTWASMMRCQDGDLWDEAAFPKENLEANLYIRLLQQYLPDKNAKILEIGAGDGGETRMFLDYGYKDITGITIGRENCKRAKKLHNVDLHFMDMHFTSFPNKSFDAIIGFQTYEHTPSPLLLGLEFNRLLRPGGKVIMEIPAGEKHFPADKNPHHLNVVELWQGKNMFRKFGFVNIKSESIGPNKNLFYAEKIGNGDHNNHFDDIINGKFLTKEKVSNGKNPSK